MVNVILKKGEEDRLLAGQLWVYDNEIDYADDEFVPGEIVEVLSSKGRFLGRGYINPFSKISVRLLTRRREEIDRDFYRRRLQEAWAYRQRLGYGDSPDNNCCRVVFGEADFLPALIVDKFGDYLCVQTLALGVDIHKEMIADLLEEMFHPKGIFERNDVPVREKEGLPQQKGFLRGQFDTTVEVVENGVRMYVDLENGQKTGYFLDQKENRAALRPYIAGKRVLDTFSHTGGFALHAAKYGAASVEAVDISAHATEFIARNARLNGFDNLTTTTDNVFDLLNRYVEEGRTYDVVILDPPAFCKTRASQKNAYRGYKEINLRAMKLLVDGGTLMTCSCSHYMYQDLFLKMLKEAAADAHKDIRVMENRMQSRDHPVGLNADESFYLKCVIVEVMDRK
ncbi:MAG: class I SAM-dependent rRNA methyltransferase [Eubacteriales bacterium]